MKSKEKESISERRENVRKLSLAIEKEIGQFCLSESVMVDEYDFCLDTKNYQMWISFENTKDDVYRVTKVEIMTFDGIVNQRFPNLIKSIKYGVKCDCSGWHKAIEQEKIEEEEQENERSLFEKDPYAFYGVSREMFV